MAPTGIVAIDDALGGGLPRGHLSEIVGGRSTGRASALCAAFAAATARGDLVALVDTLDTFDRLGGGDPVASPVDRGCAGRHAPQYLVDRGDRRVRQSCRSRQPTCPMPPDRMPFADMVSMPRVGPAVQAVCSWRRPIQREAPVAHGGVGGRAEFATFDVGGLVRRSVTCCFGDDVVRALKALGLLLQADAFGVVALDLANVPDRLLRRIPFTTWFRLPRVIEGRPTACVLVADRPIARSAGGMTVALEAGRSAVRWVGGADQSVLLRGFDLSVRAVGARQPYGGRRRGLFVTAAEAAGLPVSSS